MTRRRLVLLITSAAALTALSRPGFDGDCDHPLVAGAGGGAAPHRRGLSTRGTASGSRAARRIRYFDGGIWTVGWAGKPIGKSLAAYDTVVLRGDGSRNRSAGTVPVPSDGIGLAMAAHHDGLPIIAGAGPEVASIRIALTDGRNARPSLGDTDPDGIGWFGAYFAPPQSSATITVYNSQGRPLTSPIELPS